MSLADVEDRAVQVVGLLRNGGRAIEAHDMARLASNLSRPDKAEGALEGIIERCNIRWLGDLPLGNVGRVEWLQVLNGLENGARAELASVRERSSVRRKVNRSKKTPTSAGATNVRKSSNPWGGRSSSANQWKSSTPAKRSVKAKRSTLTATRTHSAGSRRTDLGSERWSSRGPVARGGTSFLTRVLYFFPPLALLTYSVLAIIDAMPDPFVAETIAVNGTFERSERLTNYSPLGMKGVLYLQGQNVPYGIRESLGYGFAHVVDQLKQGDRVTLRVDTDALPVDSGRLDDIVSALRGADTEQAYEIAIRSLAASGANEPIPALEVRKGNEIIYSRLETTPETENRVRTWIVFAFGSMLFMFVVRRLSVA